MVVAFERTPAAGEVLAQAARQPAPVVVHAGDAAAVVPPGPLWKYPNLITYKAQLGPAASRGRGLLGARASSPRMAEGPPWSTRARMPAIPGMRWSQPELCT